MEIPGAPEPATHTKKSAISIHPGILRVLHACDTLTLSKELDCHSRDVNWTSSSRARAALANRQVLYPGRAVMYGSTEP